MGNFKAISVRVFFFKIPHFRQYVFRKRIFKNIWTQFLIVARALVYEQDYSSFAILFGKILTSQLDIIKIEILEQLFLRTFVFLDYASQDFAEATFHVFSSKKFHKIPRTKSPLDSIILKVAGLQNTSGQLLFIFSVYSLGWI